MNVTRVLNGPEGYEAFNWTITFLEKAGDQSSLKLNESPLRATVCLTAADNDSGWVCRLLPRWLVNVTFNGTVEVDLSTRTLSRLLLKNMRDWISTSQRRSALMAVRWLVTFLDWKVGNRHNLRVQYDRRLTLGGKECSKATGMSRLMHSR